MKQINSEDINEFSEYLCKPTDWFSVTQDQINSFSECTLDKQFIHINKEAAKNTVFGTTIAQGFLTLSMLSFFAESFMPVILGIKIGINAGFDRIRFITTVKVDSRIRAKAKIINIIEKKSKVFLYKIDVEIEIEDEKEPALVAIWNVMQITQ